MSGRQSSRPPLRCDACISILRASGTIGRNRQSGKLERTYPSALLDPRSKIGPCTGKSIPPTEQRGPYCPMASSQMALTWGSS
jgi:hypothetical protein